MRLRAELNATVDRALTAVAPRKLAGAWKSSRSSGSSPDRRESKVGLGVVGRLDALEDRAGPEAAAATHRDQCAFGSGAFELMQGRGHQPGARRTHRMP